MLFRSNLVEPVMNEARGLGFQDGWLAGLQALRVPKDSPLKDPSQIPFSSFAPTMQNHPTPIDEEEKTSMKELVEQINAYVELDDMEAISIPRAGDQPSEDILQPRQTSS